MADPKTSGSRGRSQVPDGEVETVPLPCDHVGDRTLSLLLHKPQIPSSNFLLVSMKVVRVGVVVPTRPHFLSSPTSEDRTPVPSDVPLP